MTVSADTQPSEQPRIRAPQYRRRSHLTMTVQPETMNKLKVICKRYSLPVGQVVDKLVNSLDRCYDGEGKPRGLTCITGELCRWNRTDVPEVL
jgi:hypothetical protein